MQVRYVSLYHVDKDRNEILKKDIAITDAKRYVKSLAESMILSEKMREYEIATSPNTIVENIKEIVTRTLLGENEEVAATSTEVASPNESIIAERLLSAQLWAHEKYGSFTTIKKGSLIQALVEDDEDLLYILALVEHSSFIDADDLRKKIGLPNEKKATLKSARFHINNSVDISKIYLSDSQTKISEYWSDKFLDLNASKDNIENTTNAYKFIEGIISNKLSSKYQQDYIEYVNVLKVYFTRHDNFNFEECLNFVFLQNPVNSEVNTNLIQNEIINKNNEKNLFDNVFEIDIRNIKSSLLNKKYKLNSNVELKINTTENKIKENVFVTTLEDGRVVLVINNVDKKQLEKFNFNNIKL